MAKLDRRKQERFDLEIPVSLQITDAKEKEVLSLTSKNVCSGGAFLNTNCPLAIGTSAQVDLTIPLPHLEGIKSNKVLITVGGESIRIAEDGMALRFEKGFEILPMT